jgi:hypothetical protein
MAVIMLDQLFLHSIARFWLDIVARRFVAVSFQAKANQAGRHGGATGRYGQLAGPAMYFCSLPVHAWLKPCMLGHE